MKVSRHQVPDSILAFTDSLDSIFDAYNGFRAQNQNPDPGSGDSSENLIRPPLLVPGGQDALSVPKISS